MLKKFNITGTCIPERHYMGDMSDKLSRIFKMVSDGDYFTINRPRQYGKTTLIYSLEQYLRKDTEYLGIDISFEGIDSPTYQDHEKFINTILNILSRRLTFMQEKELADFIDKNKNITNFDGLSAFFTEFVVKSGRRVVLMIDEVDKSADNQLFLDFLGMLRTKYLSRNEGKDFSFHSVILAGVHDIKTLKVKISRDEKSMYNSPWNIAVSFKIDLALSSKDIAFMLKEYAQGEKVKIDIPYFSEKLFYYTSGYPFFVSCLCKIIAEDILPEKKNREWTPNDLTNSLKIVLLENNTNFGSLIKNLENNTNLYELVFDLIMNEKEFSFNLDNPVIAFGFIYGILKKENGKIRIHNRIYEQRIFNYMTSKLETSGNIRYLNIADSYLDETGNLNIERIIKKFQEFMKEQYSIKDKLFIERNGRLLFLAFIKPIINGKGFDFKEVQISEEKRLDVVLTFENIKYILELKIWRGEKYHRAGIKQLCDYLDHQNESIGYLLIYDIRKESGRSGDWEKIETNGKVIYTAWT